jgi:hypothetical protein
MPISLPKVLQGTSYTLYIITEIGLFLTPVESIRIKQRFYQSKGHYDDGFVPIILKEVTVTNQQRVNTIKLLLRENYAEALSVAENFLVNNVPYYEGGTVINGVI